jgi:hypothetical protein
MLAVAARAPAAVVTAVAPEAPEEQAVARAVRVVVTAARVAPAAARGEQEERVAAMAAAPEGRVAEAQGARAVPVAAPAVQALQLQPMLSAR